MYSYLHDVTLMRARAVITRRPSPYLLPDRNPNPSVLGLLVPVTNRDCRRPSPPDEVAAIRRLLDPDIV
jgi:hypothetical protein